MAKSCMLVWGVQKCLEIDVAHPLNLNQQLVLQNMDRACWRRSVEG
jgi:hypothetical protein